MPADVKEFGIEVIGENAQPPQSVGELERRGYVTHTPPIPSIPPETQLKHAGATTPVSLPQEGGIQVNDKRLPKEEGLSISDSKLWMRLTDGVIKGHLREEKK